MELLMRQPGCDTGLLLIRSPQREENDRGGCYGMLEVAVKGLLDISDIACLLFTAVAGDGFQTPPREGGRFPTPFLYVALGPSP